MASLLGAAALCVFSAPAAAQPASAVPECAQLGLAQSTNKPPAEIARLKRACKEALARRGPQPARVPLRPQPVRPTPHDQRDPAQARNEAIARMRAEQARQQQQEAARRRAEEQQRRLIEQQRRALQQRQELARQPAGPARAPAPPPFPAPTPAPYPHPSRSYPAPAAYPTPVSNGPHAPAPVAPPPPASPPPPAPPPAPESAATRSDAEDAGVFGVRIGGRLALPECAARSTATTCIMSGIGGAATVATLRRRLGRFPPSLPGVVELPVRIAAASCPDWLSAGATGCNMFVSIIDGNAASAFLFVGASQQATIDAALTEKYGKAPILDPESPCASDLAKVRMWPMAGIGAIYDPVVQCDVSAQSTGGGVVQVVSRTYASRVKAAPSPGGRPQPKM